MPTVGNFSERMFIQSDNESDFVVFNMTPTILEPFLVNSSSNKTVSSTASTGNFQFQIPFYMLILMLSIVGNLLVITTLIQNRRMRTITNVFLLNLALSDIMLGVLCVPFTLVGTILRDFIFGEMLCKLIPFLQGESSFFYTFLMRHFRISSVLQF